MKLSPLFALVVVACTSGPSKQDIADAPFDLEQLDAKDDSPTRPSKGQDARVAELIEDRFSGARGFIAHQIHLTEGRVDLDVTGLEDGEPLDTILYVFGPRRANGTYPILAFNDDFEPGVNVGSHIVLDVPVEGDYQIVVSTYDNYIYFPYHVSRGDYRLMVKCQNPAFEACGPAVSGTGGDCWEDADCLAVDGTPLHCEGEITCEPGTQCLFTRLGTCVEDYVYMTFEARQCGTNPWNVAVMTEAELAEFPIADLAMVKKHYGKQGVVFHELGQLTRPEPFATCAACSCPRGDEIVVRVPAIHAEALAQDGWIFSAPEPEAMGLAPAQCGSNPWEDGTATSLGEELEQIDTWLASEGAGVTRRGFAFPAEPKVTCAACSCPRGDHLLAFPVDQEDAGLLSSLGFSALYVR